MFFFNFINFSHLCTNNLEFYFFLQHRKNKSISSMLPKLRESLTKHNQSIQPLIPIAGIPASAIFTGALKNYDAHCKEIWSQNTIVSGKDSDDDEDVIDEEPMEVEEDDETVGNLDLSVDDEPNQASFRSRSTIL